MKGSTNDTIVLTDVGSGIIYPKNLTVALLDYDDQEITTDNTSQIKLQGVTPTAIIAGTDYAKVVKGVGIFDNLVFVFKPGSEHIQYQATSKAIDSSKIRAVFGSVISNNTIDVSFRFCQPGEIERDKTYCDKCAQGTYSLQWNSTFCEKCMDNVVCLGGKELEVNPGYWRHTLNSTRIIDCPREKSCLGGFYSNYSFPVECAEGYSGYLCTSCLIVNNTKFQRVGVYECERCPDPTLNAIRVVGLFILILLFLTSLIIVNIKKKKESQLSILLKIFTNYLQLVATTMSFNLKFPSFLLEAFYPVERVGSSSESFLSFDCFVEDAEIKAFTPSTVIFKLFLTGLLPILLIGCIILIWILLFITGHRWFKEVKRNIVVSIICIMFLLHPTLTKQALTIFQ